MSFRLHPLLTGLMALLAAAFLTLGPVQANAASNPKEFFKSIDQGIDGAVSAGVSSAVYGTSFGDGFIAGLTSSSVNLAMADFQNAIGDWAEVNGGEGSLGHIILHAGLGCAASEALGGDCTSGALAGATQAIYAGSLGDARETMTEAQALAASRRIELVGAIAGYLSSGGSAENVSNAALIAQSGFDNNYLVHADLEEWADRAEACTSEVNVQDCLKDVYLDMLERSADRDQNLIASCFDTTCLEEARNEALNYTAFRAFIQTIDYHNHPAGNYMLELFGSATSLYDAPWQSMPGQPYGYALPGEVERLVAANIEDVARGACPDRSSACYEQVAQDNISALGFLEIITGLDILVGGGQLRGTEFPGVSRATNRTLLIEDLVAGGTRITPENVVDIRSVNGRTVWLETGDANAGLRHIVGEHGPEFSQRGISEVEIPDVIFTALQRNNVVGHQGRGTGRPIYEFDYGGQTHRLAITVGDNGFVVGANFR